ncbi:MAG: CopD family protein [Pseudomonadota bacterium]
MTYALLKAAHLISLFAWIGGMTAVAIVLRYPDRTLLNQIKAYDRAVTSSAMVAAWVFGISLAVMGGWFSQSWLAIKVLFVLVLSGLHGVLAGKLRRYTSDVVSPEPGSKLFLPFGLMLVTIIVLLVTLKM